MTLVTFLLEAEEEMNFSAQFDNQKVSKPRINRRTSQ